MDKMTTQLIAHVSGNLDGEPKHPKSADAVYRALGWTRVEEAAQAVNMIAKQEAVLVNTEVSSRECAGQI